MNNKLDIASYVALGASIGFAVGAGSGALLDGANGRNHSGAALEAQAEQYQSDVIEFESRSQKFVAIYAPECLNLLDNYAPDGPLAAVPQSDIVNDLLANPTQPCGVDATHVRIAADDVLGVKTKLAELHAYDFNANYQKQLDAKKDNQEDEDFDGWLVGGLALALLGSGLVLQDSYKQLKFEKRKQQSGDEEEDY